MYKLYTDKNESFECKVSVKNASLKNSIARLVVETPHINLIFEGRINGDKCIVPIKKLRGILPEEIKGKMHLEIIVEDTYFKPWESEFVVEENTSLKVEVVESTNKPLVEVSAIVSSKKINHTASEEILTICERFKINKHTINERKSDFKQIIKEYFKSNAEYNKDKISIINEVSSLLR